MAASRPSFPNDPHPRRLGVGGSPSSGERLVRAQLVIALVCGFTLLAVVLYLWRRPGAVEHAANDPSEGSSASASPSAGAPSPGVILRTKVDEEKKPVPTMKLGAVQHVKCGASPRLMAGDNHFCDSLPFFEQALTKAVTDGATTCPPKSKDEGTISYVLIVDFPNKQLRMYPGRSGSWRGPQAKKTVDCVKRSLPSPAWETMAHQYRYYMLAALASYPAAVEAAPPDFK